MHHSFLEVTVALLVQLLSVVRGQQQLSMMPLLGFHPLMVLTMISVSLVYQFFLHTESVRRFPRPIEWFFNTPSHHRVHHAINPEYIDKNYGNIFIFWDKWFGTFQAELSAVPPVYGVTRPAQTWNPVLFNLQHFWLLLKDAWGTKRYWDKLRIWWMPTGWRPKDMQNRYPVFSIKDVYQLEKYDSHPSLRLLAWTWIQLSITLGLMFFLFDQLAEIGVPGIFVYGFFLLVSIFSYTALLDRANYALAAELFRMCLGLLIIWWQGSWFGLEHLLPQSNLLIIIFLLSSAMISGYLFFTEVSWKDKRKVAQG